MAFANFLTETATIMALDSLRDANGGIYESWAEVTTCSCLVQPRGGSIFREDERDGSAATHNILLLGQHSLSAVNQIHVNTLKYNVVKPVDWNNLGHHTTVECILETS